MNIGIKYCGGCNPHFDRTYFLNKIIELFKDTKFEYAGNDKFYDIIIIINGCSRGCADFSSLKSNKKIFISSETDYKDVVELIQKEAEL